MIEIKAKDLLKSDYQLLGEQHIKLQQENKQLKEYIKKIESNLDFKSDLLDKIYKETTLSLIEAIQDLFPKKEDDSK